MWTTLKNNVSPQTPVMSAEKNGNAVLPVTYNVTDEQVHWEEMNEINSRD